MGLRDFFQRRPSPDSMNRMLIGLLTSINTPIVQSSRHEIALAEAELPDSDSRALLTLALMQVALLSVLNVIDKKKPRPLSANLHGKFATLGLNTFDFGDPTRKIKAFNALRDEIGEVLETESVDEIRSVGNLLLSIALPDQERFTMAQVGAVSNAAIKVWADSSFLADIALLEYKGWKSLTAHDQILSSSSRIITHAFRSMILKKGINLPKDFLNFQILETYFSICSVFRVAARTRKETLSTEQLNLIALKFVVVRAQGNDGFYREHLDYEISVYLSSGLRQDYKEGWAFT